MTKPNADHWDSVYAKRAATEVSWYQARPDTSLALIERSGIAKGDALIDVGGGASTLVDHLLAAGYTDLSVLDIAAGAFTQSQQRLGTRADAINWIVSDVTQFEPQRGFRLWHDRAVLHFLTQPEHQVQYVDVLQQALEPGGTAIIATFGPDGPTRCSGLDIQRYNIASLESLLAPRFELQSHELEYHQTPTGGEQQFLYSCWTRRG